MDVKLHKSFDICFKFLKFHGLWFDGEETRNYRIYGISLIILCPMMFLTLLILGIYQNGLTTDSAEALTYIIASTVELIRILHLIIHLKEIKLLYEMMIEAMKLTKKEELIIKRLDFCLKMFISVVGNAYLAVIAGWFTSYKSRKIPYPYGDPFNEDIMEFLKIPFFIYSSSIVIYIAPVFAALGFLPVFFMNFIIGFMEEFNERLENFGKNYQTDEGMNKELSELVGIHEKIQILTNKLTRHFRVSFFVIGVAGSLVLCMSVFVIPLVSMITSV
jgi:hypothetical protein